MKIRTAHGMRQAPALNMKTACKACRKGLRILPTLRRIIMIEALARGRIGMLSKLKLRRTYMSVLLVPHAMNCLTALPMKIELNSLRIAFTHSVELLVIPVG